MSDDQLLRDEYLAIHKAIEEFDARALTIKAWSVTISAAGLAAAYVEDEPEVLLIAAAGAFVFWYVEALWKASQSAYYPRMEEIERHFSGSGSSTRPFQMAASRKQTLAKKQKEKRALKSMIWPHVAFPHLPIALVGLLLYFFIPPEAPPKTPTPPPSAAPR